MAEQRTDFLMDSDGDFPLEDNVINGQYLDTPYGLSDNQHIEDNIMYMQGYLKQFLNHGFGAFNYLNSENATQRAKKNLKIVMESDGYNVSNKAIEPVADGFTINTQYIVRK